jgi:putative transcriptional regulator
MGFGEMLQREREKAGMSQPELAKAAGVPVGTLRNWEQGRRYPRPEAIARLAKALGLEADDLVTAVARAWYWAAMNKPRRRKKGGD